MTTLPIWAANIFTRDGVPEALAREVFKGKGGAALNKLRPHVFNPELVRGCNLRCSFCVARLFPAGQRAVMNGDTWVRFVSLIEAINPTGHITFATIGEPTLHPSFLTFVQYARERLPKIQMELYTNGTTLLQGRIRYKELFEAGINSVFVDMYHDAQEHEAIARASGFAYHVVSKETKSPENLFLHHKDRDFHFILLAPNPGDWHKARKRAKKMQTWLNNLDWSAAREEYGLEPVELAPTRRCDQLQRSLNVSSSGFYNTCCLDCMNETTGKLGTIHDGLEGFFRFWLGDYMQLSRRLLFEKKRREHPLCSRCSFISGRADIALWPESFFESFYDGERWQPLVASAVDMTLKPKRAFVLDGEPL